jgi:site-specific DNA-methyltransferase (adenine-specific)
MQLINDDCLNALKKIKDKSIDLILTDPPYGTTQCKWDNVIPFEPMWNELKRVIKDNGCIALFGSEPFSSALRMSNIENFKYDWVWDKVQPTGMPLVKKMPMKQHEIVSIFYSKQPTYNRQMTDRPPKDVRVNAVKNKLNQKTNKGYNHNGTIICKYANDYDPTKVNPKSIITFSKQPKRIKNIHPTQKPVALLEYLIKTYTNANDKVLDFTMGSGSTGVACKNTNRNFIGIELDKDYFDIAQQRIENANNYSLQPKRAATRDTHKLS